VTATNQPTTTQRTTTRPDGVPAVLQHYIGGELVDSVDGATLTVIDPVTHTRYAEVASGGTADVDRAVAAARTAFLESGWPELPARQRSDRLRTIADAIVARSERITAWEAYDTGLPASQARGQAVRAAENFRYFADVCTSMHEDAFRTPSQIGYVVRRPRGVAGLITPWNVPFMLATWKLAPCLAAGCTLILKPAELSPLTASLLPEIMEEAGLPPGVFNIVHGVGETAGTALVAHPDVPLISFTGETTTGKTIMRTAAEHLKGLSMELGGKSPCVVFADADLDAAIDSALFGVFSLNGERCTAGSRILVERPVYAEVVERLAARAAAIRVGDPADETTEVGALISTEHYERVMSYVDAGREEGARLVAGGARPDHLPVGNYLAPTVFADVAPTMRIFREEIFGPVVCVTPFDTEFEALELANGTPYGLAAYVWTNDLRRGHRFVHRIEAGMIWLNSHNVRDLRTPFGGVKQSGLGREGGEHSLDFYTDTTIVHVALGDTHVPRFGAVS
jgi:5-carboxymethyl-2-hydroxymuconic-semialdehyde dehydrogenase